MGADIRRISLYFVLESQQVNFTLSSYGNLQIFHRSSHQIPVFYDLRSLPRTDITGKMSNLSRSQNRYTRFENTRWVPSYHAGPTHAIKSEYGTSSQSMNGIPTIPSQRHSNHEPSDAYVNYAQLSQLLDHSLQSPQFPLSHQMAQFQPSSQTSELSIGNQVPQLPYPPTARTPLPQPPYLEESSRPSGETPFYVNAKQFERILKRRVARQRVEEGLGCTPGSRRSYLHESRHKHVIRRPRGPGGRFLNKDELERPKKEVQTGTIVRCQIPETRTGPNTNHVKEESADLVAGMPTNDGRGERREEARNGSRDKEPHQPEAWQTSITLSQSQVHAKGSNHISRAMTTSFCGAAELEELHRRFPTRTAADVQRTERNCCQ